MRRWFLPHLTAFMAATLGGISAAFTILPHLSFPIFAALSLWGLGVALHAYLVIIAQGPDQGG